MENQNANTVSEPIEVSTNEKTVKKPNRKKVVIIFVAVIAIIGIMFLSDGKSSTFTDLCSFVKRNGVKVDGRYVISADFSNGTGGMAIVYDSEEDTIGLVTQDKFKLISTTVYINDVSDEYKYYFRSTLEDYVVCEGSGTIPASEFSKNYSTTFDVCKLEADDKYRLLGEERSMRDIHVILSNADRLIADSGITMKDFGFTNY